MASAEFLNLERLLSPIDGENPCGADLRWEPVYEEIKAARPKGDRDPLADEDAELTVDWRPAFELLQETLETRTKDLMLAAWLIESAVHLGGFAAFRDGLKLLNGLLESFWDGLYPGPGGDDLEVRAAPLVFLTTVGRGAMLPNLLRDSPLFPDAEGANSLNYWKTRQPLPGEPMDSFNQRAEDVAEKTRKFDNAAARTSLDAIRTVLEDIEQAAQELTRLNSLIDQRFGDVGPSVGALRSSLEDCQRLARSIARDKGGLDDTAAGGEAAAETQEAASANGSGGARGPIRTREDAFRQLAEVATFLRQKEPQNPIYLLVERAVLWSKMPFEELLRELVKDAGARGQIGELLGIKSQQDE